MCENFIILSNPNLIKFKYNLESNQFIKPINRPALLSGGDLAWVITSKDTSLLQSMRFGFTKEYSEKQCDNLSFDTSKASKEEGHNESDQITNFFIKHHLLKVIYSFRCVIIVDAFIVSTPDNKHYLIHMQNKERPFAIAGIYDHWQNPETGIYSTGFATLTTKSNPMLQNIGIEQMPVIISSKKVTDWLDSKQQIEKILSSIHTYPDETMNGYQVSSKIFSEPLTKEILQPIGQKFKPDLIKTVR